MLPLPNIKRHLTHRILQSRRLSVRSNELRGELNRLKREEKKALSRLGYSVYAKGDAVKYGRPGRNLLEIEEDMSAVENLLYVRERKIRY